MRGYFGIGVEGISKPMNFGAVMRTAHAFGASFAFTVGDALPAREIGQSDTSHAAGSLPFYAFGRACDLLLPRGCALVGVEITEEAIELPSFRHPRRAAYVLGPERGALSRAMLARCDHVVRIPLGFAINVGLAGALVMYDRMITLGRFAPRPVSAGGPVEPLPAPEFGPPAWVRKQARSRAVET